MNKALEKAILETYQRYGMKQANVAIIMSINNANKNGFVNAGNEIDLLEAKEFKEEIFGKYLEAVLNADTPRDALESAIQKTYKKYETRGDAINVVENCLNDLFKGDNHFTRDGGERQVLDALIKKLSPNSNVQEWMLGLISQRVTEAVINEALLQKSMAPQNVQIYTENIQKLQEAMISGLTYDKEGSIQISNMQAATSIGNRRPNQEDAVLLMVHPANSKFKMMVVSDGMGGANAGEEASHTTIQEMRNWFSRLPVQYYKNVSSLQELLIQEINMISNKIYNNLGGNGGATFVGAIVGEKETLISNVGDSRGYMLKGKELIPITRDHSVVQNLYENGEIERRDDMRFHKSSNYITQFIGAQSVNPQFYIKDNKEYDMLFLFSDGVTDCLSDSQLLGITKTTDRKLLASIILQNALTNKSILRNELLGEANYAKQIDAGKDNTTAAILFNDERDS